MHPEAYAFVQRVAPPAEGRRVLEIGAYDVNGNPRALFPSAEYVGLDTRPGPGVDVVADGATWAGDGRRFDVVVSTETLEHAPDPAAILANARRRLKVGGLLIVTLAATSRPPHGIDGGALGEGETYTRISRADLAGWLADWDDVAIEHHPSRGDLYATARKPRGGDK